MAKMNQETRQNIVDIFKQHGFDVKLKLSGKEEYKKNLMFNSAKFGSSIYISKDTGISPSGEVNYLKVAVDPKYFRADAVDFSKGVESAVNKINKKNLFLSSNYKDFPIESGEVEPSAKCYKVANLESLGVLLSNLSR